MKLNLSKEWTIGEQFSNGGFGKIFHAVSPEGENVVAKFIPKVPGATREMLFADQVEGKNIIPIIDNGETSTDYVLIMPLASMTLRDRMSSTEKQVSNEEALVILKDIATALKSISDKVVHRDIKPENILFYNGNWCLADFGISRYAEATTASDTRKHSLTPAYAAPERWRNERATSLTDIYSLGVVAYEMYTSSLPFKGPTTEDFREQHLHEKPSTLDNCPMNISSLIAESLFKAPESRPSPANFLARLNQASVTPKFNLESLKKVNEVETSRISQAALQSSLARTEMERREELSKSAAEALENISITLRDSIMEAAPTAQLARNATSTWFVRLSDASLEFTPVIHHIIQIGHHAHKLPFDVISSASINLKSSIARNGYEGRSHSLWYCDAKNRGEFGWYETAFMYNPLIQRGSTIKPFSLDPGEESAKALAAMISEYQTAWPFTILNAETLIDFVERWADWFATAAINGYRIPSQMPERRIDGTWRRS